MTDPLVCPVSRVPLRLVTLADAGQQLGGELEPPVAAGYRPMGVTPMVLLREDLVGAYPVVDGIPVLLAPEMLTTEPAAHAVDIADPGYAEAYREMEYYSSTAAAEAQEVASSAAARRLDLLLALSEHERSTFPSPQALWLDAGYELAAQWDAFEHLSPVDGSRVLQIGGRGLQAVKFLLAGAEQVWLLSPMVGELVYARKLAEYAGVADRLRCAAAVAEQLPLSDACMDDIYSQGCVHHWATHLALPECARVLRPGGRFSAVEPWRAPLYGLGTRVLGKRDPAVQCVVLTADRVAPHMGDFAAGHRSHHGTLTRYPLIALGKLGLKPSRRTLWWLGRLDDAICSLVPPIRRRGSSVAILAVARDAVPTTVGPDQAGAGAPDETTAHL